MYYSHIYRKRDLIKDLVRECSYILRIYRQKCYKIIAEFTNCDQQ